jgi:hypothetical protein
MRVQRTRSASLRSPLTRGPLGGFALLTAIVLTLAGACAQKPTSTPRVPVVKVYIQADGTILADGKPVGLDELKKMFVDLKVRHGAVMYDRAGAEGSPPPPHAMDVIGAIAEAQLPTVLEDQPGVSIELRDKQ